MNRIFLVDDHPVMRGGLKQLLELEPDFEVCGEAASAEEAFGAITELMPDLVVADIALPDRSGLELLKDLQAAAPDLKTFVFSTHDELLYAERVLKAGGRGYLAKGSSREALIGAVRDVLAGKISLTSRASNYMLNRMRPGASSQECTFGPAILSDRELEIFQMLGMGLSTPEIARKLHISARTADAHRNNIRLKLSLPDSAALLREAVIWVELGEARVQPAGTGK